MLYLPDTKSRSSFLCNLDLTQNKFYYRACGAEILIEEEWCRERGQVIEPLWRVQSEEFLA